MDVVKMKERCANKVVVGDCVSVPDNYFGKAFQKTVWADWWRWENLWVHSLINIMQVIMPLNYYHE